MKTIYIDSDFKCYVVDTGTLIPIETDFFDGKCDTYIEGYRFVPKGETWTREDGVVFQGEMVSPWKDYYELDNAQREYEKQQLAEYKAIVEEQDLMILDLQYNTLTEGL